MRIRIKDVTQLNELIIMKGFSKIDFGKEINLSQPMIVQLTRGTRAPSPRTAKRICEVLDCEWEELFEIVKTPEQAAK